MILSVPPAESMIFSERLLSPLSPLPLPPSTLPLPLLSSLQSSLLLPTSNPSLPALSPLLLSLLPHFLLQLLVDCCLALPAESMILSACAESIILSAGGAESIILSASSTESMMLSSCAESMILSAPPFYTHCAAQEARRVDARAALTAVAAFSLQLLVDCCYFCHFLQLPLLLLLLSLPLSPSLLSPSSLLLSPSPLLLWASAWQISPLPHLPPLFCNIHVQKSGSIVCAETRKRQPQLCWSYNNKSLVLEVITVRKDNISNLIAEYLDGGFMRWWWW